MRAVFIALFHFILSFLRSRQAVALEIVALRHQLAVLHALEERHECEALLAAIAAEKDGKLDVLRRWIEDQTGYDFSRTRLLGELMKEARFAAAYDVVAPFAQLLDLGCPQNHVRDRARADLAAWFESCPREAPSRARTLLDHATKTAAGRREWRTAAFLCLPFVDAIAPAYDDIVADLCGVHRDDEQERTLLEALGKMPVDRRDACLDAVLARGATRRLTDAMLALASVALANRVVELRAGQRAEREQEARAKAAAMRAAPFRFVEPTRVLPKDYDTLDPVGQAHYRAIAGGYVQSGRARDPSDFIRQLKQEGLDESDAELRRWKVLRGEDHVFDLWVVWVENAAFFSAGSAKQIPVYVVQGAYLTRDDRPETKELANDLANSERESLWSLPAKKRRAKKKPPRRG